MFNILFQGILIFGTYWLELLVLLLSGLGIGAILALFLFRNNKNDDRIIYVLLLGFVFLGVAAPALRLVEALNMFVVVFITILNVVALIALVKYGYFSHWHKAEYQKNIWIPSGIFIVFLILRLGFLRDLILPPFSDSAEHFERLSSLLPFDYIQTFTFKNFFPYYHWGFHGITAWVDIITGDFDPLTMTVAAHFFLGLLPVTVYFMLLSLVDGDVSVAVFGALLAGLGWIMPAYAISFGKYPALVAICLLPLLLGGIYLNNKLNNSKQWGWWLYILIVSSALIWIHSRMAIFLAFFYLTYYLSRFIGAKLSKNVFETGVLFLFFLIIFWVLFLDQGGTARISFKYYLGVFDNSTFLVVALLPFAFRKYTTWVFQWALMIILLMLTTNVALPSWFYNYQLTLLDQLFFDLILFLPLTILGALGMSGAKKLLPIKGYFYRDLLMFVLFIVVINGVFIQPWQPLGSSNYVAQDDIRAFSWIKNDTQPASQFIIAAIEKNAEYSRASDSGIWISLLTGRSTIKVPFTYQWDSLEDFGNICSKVKTQNPVYVYVGHMETSFIVPSCNQQPGLSPILCYPQTKIFALDCNAFAK
jgi:hypothetical protein